MHHTPVFLQDLALILIVAGSISIVFQSLRIPLVLGYLISGFLLGPHFTLLPSLTDSSSIATWSELGLIFLMFGLGLHFRTRDLLRSTGAAQTALMQFGLPLILVFTTTQLLGLGREFGFFLATALSISSTSMILKTFEENSIMANQSSKLSMQVLVFEDLLALLSIVILSGFAISHSLDGWRVIEIGFRFLVFLVGFLIVGLFLVPQVFSFFEKKISSESLLLFSLGLCFLYVKLAASLGFSTAFGAFLMGAILAETRYRETLDRLLQPLKYLFLAVFFISLGMMLEPKVFLEKGWLILLFAGLAIAGKFFGNFLGHLSAGEKAEPAFAASLPMVMIGEFSLLIAGLAAQTKNLSQDFLSLVAGLTLILSAVGPLLVRNEKKLFKALAQVPGFRKITQKIAREKSPDSAHSPVFMLIPVCLLVIWTLLIERLGKAFFQTLPLPDWIELTLLWALHVCGLMVFSSGLLVSMTQSQKQVWILHSSRAFISLLCLMLQLVAFPSSLSALGTALIYIFFHTRVSGLFYQIFQKLEVRFLQQFANEAFEPQYSQTPWETHLHDFTMGEKSKLIGTPIKDLKALHLPVLISSIRRGESVLVAPGGEETFQAFDVISALGTDDALKSFEKKINEMHTRETLVNPELFNVLLTPDHVLVGKRLIDSDLRNKALCLVVGIERGPEKIPTPGANFVLDAGDILWLVGEREKFNQAY